MIPCIRHWCVLAETWLLLSIYISALVHDKLGPQQDQQEDWNLACRAPFDRSDRQANGVRSPLRQTRLSKGFVGGVHASSGDDNTRDVRSFEEHHTPGYLLRGLRHLRVSLCCLLAWMATALSDDPHITPTAYELFSTAKDSGNVLGGSSSLALREGVVEKQSFGLGEWVGKIEFAGGRLLLNGLILPVATLLESLIHANRRQGGGFPPVGAKATKWERTVHTLWDLMVLEQVRPLVQDAWDSR